MDPVKITFMNADATPKNVSVVVDRSAMRQVIAWYGGYHAGDRYTVAMDGRNVPLDHNGEAML